MAREQQQKIIGINMRTLLTMFAACVPIGIFLGLLPSQSNAVPSPATPAVRKNLRSNEERHMEPGKRALLNDMGDGYKTENALNTGYNRDVWDSEKEDLGDWDGLWDFPAQVHAFGGAERDSFLEAMKDLQGLDEIEDDGSYSFSYDMN